MIISNNKVIFEALYPDVIFPQRATTGAAGYDVRVYLEGRTVNVMDGARTKETHICRSELVLRPGERAAVPLGFRASLPVLGQVDKPRSSQRARRIKPLPIRL